MQYEVASIMLKATNEERGTVAALGALSKELESIHDDGVFTNIFITRSAQKLN